MIDNQAETMAEAVFELLNKIKSILFPFVWKSLGSSVISTQSMDSWFNQNQSVFSVLIFSAFLHVSSDIDGFLNQTVNIFWDLWGTSWIKNEITVLLQQSDDFLTSQQFNAWYGLFISDGNTDLRWWHTFFGHSDD